MLCHSLTVFIRHLSFSEAVPCQLSLCDGAGAVHCHRGYDECSFSIQVPAQRTKKITKKITKNRDGLKHSRNISQLAHHLSLNLHRLGTLLPGTRNAQEGALAVLRGPCDAAHRQPAATAYLQTLQPAAAAARDSPAKALWNEQSAEGCDGSQS